MSDESFNIPPLGGTQKKSLTTCCLSVASTLLSTPLSSLNNGVTNQFDGASQLPCGGCDSHQGLSSFLAIRGIRVTKRAISYPTKYATEGVVTYESTDYFTAPPKTSNPYPNAPPTYPSTHPTHPPPHPQYPPPPPPQTYPIPPPPPQPYPMPSPYPTQPLSKPNQPAHQVLPCQPCSPQRSSTPGCHSSRAGGGNELKSESKPPVSAKQMISSEVAKPIEHHHHHHHHNAPSTELQQLIGTSLLEGGGNEGQEANMPTAPVADGPSGVDAAAPLELNDVSKRAVEAYVSRLLAQRQEAQQQVPAPAFTQASPNAPFSGPDSCQENGILQPLCSVRKSSNEVDSSAVQGQVSGSVQNKMPNSQITVRSRGRMTLQKPARSTIPSVLNEQAPPPISCNPSVTSIVEPLSQKQPGTQNAPPSDGTALQSQPTSEPQSKRSRNVRFVNSQTKSSVVLSSRKVASRGAGSKLQSKLGGELVKVTSRLPSMPNSTLTSGTRQSIPKSGKPCSKMLNSQDEPAAKSEHRGDVGPLQEIEKPSSLPMSRLRKVALDEESNGQKDDSTGTGKQVLIVAVAASAITGAGVALNAVLSKKLKRKENLKNKKWLHDEV